MTKNYIYLFTLTLICLNVISAQNFTLITDQSNPIAATQGPTGYTGISWVDYNNDDNLDLFINHSTLFKNNGNGIFEKVTTSIGSGQSLSTGNGNSWGDYDNDGDLDVYISGTTSYLYRNDGSDTFTKITEGDIGNGFANRGWSCAWGDYNNDGSLDLLVSHPAGFVGASTTNHLLKNNGDGTFSSIHTGDVVSGLAPYTVATWSDFDNDGDYDISIGSGPAGQVLGSDYFYKNNLKESGTASFTRITGSGPSSQLRDGQVWNWIDYDNDGDLDVYITNWGGNLNPVGLANDLYRNEGGSFTRITAGSIVTTRRVSLASVWADFDNDGDLDCYVANENGGSDSYYRNDGDGNFTSLTSLSIVTTQN